MNSKNILKLPDLILFENYSGDWELYLDAIYSFFKKDFIESKPSYKGIKLGLKKYPMYKNKEATFWHFVSEGEMENERTPDLKRCERIRWPRPIIENPDSDNIKFWENKRGLKENICLCFGEWEYLVVLRKGNNYLIPWTAYCSKYEHTKRKWEKEYNEYIVQKANTAS